MLLTVAGLGSVGLVADGTGAAQPDPPRAPVSQDPLGEDQPAGRELGDMVRAAQARSAIARARRNTPEQRAERRASRRRFSGLMAGQAAELVRTRYAASAAAPPLQPLKDVRLLELIDPVTARVERDGVRQLLTSNLPLAVPTDDDASPVDLSLRSRGDAFVPSQPLVPLTLPRRLGSGAALPDGVRLSPAARDADGYRVEGSVVYPQAADDTDLIFRPVPAGVELFAVLRSQESPEILDVEVDGQGIRLRRISDGSEAIEVVRGDTVLGRIGRLAAVDASGKSLETSTEIDGTTLRLRVRHRDADVEYPLLADPPYIVESLQDWKCGPPSCAEAVKPVGWDGRSGWLFQQNMDGNGNPRIFPSGDQPRTSWLGYGLYADHSSNGRTFNAGEYAYWQFPSPGTTRIIYSELNSSIASRSGTNACLFAGISAWGPNGFYWEKQDQGSMCGDGRADVCCGEEWLNITHDFSVTGGIDNSVLAGIYFPDTRLRSFFAHNLAYARIGIWDEEFPSIKTDVTAAWRNDKTVDVTASDPGSGVRHADLNGELYNENCALAQGPNRCKTTRTFVKEFPEGVTPLAGSVRDLSGLTQHYGGGLRSRFYDKRDFTFKRPERADGNIDFFWGSRSPMAGMPTDNYAARWDGQLLVPSSQQSGTYTFTLDSDDTATLKINGQTVIAAGCCGEKSGSIYLEAGKKYDVFVEYTEVTAQAWLRMYWAGPGLSKRIVQPYSLLPPKDFPQAPTEVKVDTKEPDTTLAGEALDYPALAAGAHQLTINAVDPKPTGVTRVSGARTSEIRIDGVSDPTNTLRSASSCTENCDIAGTYTFPADTVNEGERKLHVVTRDGATNEEPEDGENAETVIVDRRSPEATLDGPLYDTRNDVSPGIHELHIDGADPGPAAGIVTAGIDRFEITVSRGAQSVREPDLKPDANGDAVYRFNAARFPAGTYRITVRTFDRAKAPDGSDGNPAHEDPLDVVVNGPDVLKPKITGLDHEPALPSGWVQRYAGSVTVEAEDFGFGLRRIEMRQPRPSGPANTTSKWFCALPSGDDVDCTEGTACQGTVTSLCPWTGGKTFNYNTDPFPEGDTRPGAAAYDAPPENNESDEATWRLRIDRTPPTVKPLQGALWDRRNRPAGEDQRFQGLYDRHHALTITADDGLSGVREIDVQLLATNGDVVRDFPDDQPQTCDAGCSKTRTWTLDGDEVADGVYSVRVVARDQAGNATEGADAPTFPITVDRRGDIYATQATRGDASSLLHREWGQVTSMQGRHEDPVMLTTRATVPCDEQQPDGAQCGEVRQVPNSAPGTIATRRSNDPDDPNLTVAADFVALSREDLGAEDASGPLADAAEPWQKLPPAHGDRFLRYDHVSSETESELAGDETEGTPTETTASESLFVDETTGMPIRVTRTYSDGEMEHTYWAYEIERSEEGDIPDLFRASRPANPEWEETTEYTGATSPGPTTDAETNRSYSGSFLGLAPQLTLGRFCLVSAIRHSLREPAGNPDPDADAVPYDLTRVTQVQAEYAPVAGTADCVAGVGVIDDATLEVLSFERSSSMATLLREQFAATGAAIALDPNDGGFVGANPMQVSLAGEPTSAWLARAEEGEMTLLVDAPNATVQITGQFTRDHVANLVDSLLELP